MAIVSMTIISKEYIQNRQSHEQTTYLHNYILFMILEMIHNYKMLTSFKVKILPLHVSIRNSVLGSFES